MKSGGPSAPILESSALPKTVHRHKASEAEAEAMDREAVRLTREMKSSWFRLGSLIRDIADTQAYAVLGFPSIQAWMDARLGESASSAFSALRSVRALEVVPEEKLKRIGERNANALTYLPKKDRTSDEWIEKATTLSTKEFKQETKAYIAKKTGLPADKFKTFSIALPEPVYEMLLAAEKKIARSLDLDIETHTGQRILLWEAWSQWILLTDEETIKAQTEGVADFDSRKHN